MRTDAVWCRHLIRRFPRPCPGRPMPSAWPWSSSARQLDRSRPVGSSPPRWLPGVAPRLRLGIGQARARDHVSSSGALKPGWNRSDGAPISAHSRPPRTSRPGTSANTWSGSARLATDWARSLRNSATASSRVSCSLDQSMLALRNRCSAASSTACGSSILILNRQYSCMTTGFASSTREASHRTRRRFPRRGYHPSSSATEEL